ncbi:ubiquitin carboxyl-terminal hydrolase 15-like [Zingiber officinale]|uniref:ubiquitin carboxyl-terminal hydrolase 15-like n=1 Tax=Zingiber officinale TaxID=94328 RepID=UPI001C4D6B35|nr:ubiquitin carboxyl-terminal hydrolase 15-like [Zingiber officinale]XP_042430178.1 ubiquitin carboxyl-terminal hydrolase 15-like [Zingiber officinale]
MLQPREADLTALLTFLVVIPLFIYILLGRCSEASKKKARISVLAQLAAEEAIHVEAMTTVDVLPVLPSSKIAFHECARCFAPATTRCSRCKLVRYCSGKCQIVHWRQGHKHECLQWLDNSLNVSAGLLLKDALQQGPFLNNLKSSYLCNGVQGAESLRYSFHNDIYDPFLMATDASQDSDTGRKISDKFKMIQSNGGDDDSHAFDQDQSHDACGKAMLSNHFTEMSSEDLPAGQKFTGGTASSTQVHVNQEINGLSNSRNMSIQHNNLAGDIRKELKHNSSPITSSQSHVDKRLINGFQNGESVSEEKPGVSYNETVNASHTTGHYFAKESIMYRKPPYTLGHTTSSLQKMSENNSKHYHHEGAEKTSGKENGFRIMEKNDSSNICFEVQDGNPSIQGLMGGSKKSAKVLKRNLVGLINDNKKNKLGQLLFPYEDLVKLFQCEESHISPKGLLNCGNSCYANAVLQCLTSTKPLMVYLLRRGHSRTCCVKKWCLMCELEQHASLLSEEGGPLSPIKILSNMTNIGCRMGSGNQEDAHEFLRLLVMSMQSVCLEGLGGEKEVDPWLQETTLIQQIFGGRLKSKVKCLRCHLESERYESIMDLTLEIHGWVESLEDALTQFTAPEDLDGENMYRCGRCLSYVKARKQLSLHEVPNILTIVLKRFQTGKYGKINKCVTFPDMLDMIPFVTGTADKPPLYLLYAVVVHLDNSNASFAGHYISYIKDLQGTWFRIDDSQVEAVSPGQVMSEGAYMLFYSRSFPRPPHAFAEKKLLCPLISTGRNLAKSQKTSKYAPPRVNSNLHSSANSVHQHPTNDLGSNYSDNTTDQAAEHLSRPFSRNLVPDGAYPDATSIELSDVTSSDWSLFTSSDDSSFTTESTRDSFSTVDHGDNTTLDTISSIFSPFYVPEYASSNTISCTKFSGSQSQTRFFSESSSVDNPPFPMRPISSVNKGRTMEHARASTEPVISRGHQRSMYGEWE